MNRAHCSAGRSPSNCRHRHAGRLHPQPRPAARLQHATADRDDLPGRLRRRRGSSTCSVACGARSRRPVPISAPAKRNCTDAQVSLLAEVARNYFELRGSQLRLDIANARHREPAPDPAPDRSAPAARRRLRAGRGQCPRPAQLRCRRSCPCCRRRLSAGEFRLAVLLGERPGELDIDLSPKSFTADRAEPADRRRRRRAAAPARRAHGRA